MTHTSSRKQFVAKLLGVVGAASIAPKMLAKPAANSDAAAANQGKSNRQRAFEVRHDARTVARRDVA